jgi:hypothetical protein
MIFYAVILVFNQTGSSKLVMVLLAQLSKKLKRVQRFQYLTPVTKQQANSGFISPVVPKCKIASVITVDTW